MIRVGVVVKVMMMTVRVVMKVTVRVVVKVTMTVSVGDKSFTVNQDS